MLFYKMTVLGGKRCLSETSLHLKHDGNKGDSSTMRIRIQNLIFFRSLNTKFRRRWRNNFEMIVDNLPILVANKWINLGMSKTNFQGRPLSQG